MPTQTPPATPSTDAFQTALEASILVSLDRAMENAVAAQNNLNTVGIAIVAQESAKVLDQPSGPSAAEVEAARKKVQEATAKLPSNGASEQAATDAAATSAVVDDLMGAFSRAMHQLNQVNVAYMEALVALAGITTEAEQAPRSGPPVGKK